MTIKEFLDQNAFNLTPEEYNQALTDYQENMDTQEWVDHYAPMMQNKASGWSELDAVKVKDLPTRLAAAFGNVGFNPGKEYLAEVKERDFKDVPDKKFNDGLKKMKEYYDQFTAEQEKEAGRIRRQKEVKNWGLVRSALASDYEKQRYIDDPDAAIFGDEGDGKWYNKGEAVSDLLYGAAGAVGDAVPGFGSVILGPGARAARDLHHYIGDSKYQKSGSDIRNSIAADVGLSVGTYALPNFRLFQKVMNKTLPEVPKAVAARDAIVEEAGRIRTGLETPLPGTNYNLVNVINNTAEGLQRGEREMIYRQLVEDMPESYVKADLYKLLGDRQGFDWAKARKIMENARATASAAELYPGRELLRSTKEYGNFPPAVTDVPTYEGQKAITDDVGAKLYLTREEPLDPLTIKILGTREPTVAELKKDALRKTLEGGFNKGSSAVANWVATGTNARGKGKPERVRTPEEQEALDVIKAQEERFWEAGFKPNKVEGDPLWEAYSEWDENRKRKDAIKQSLLRGK
jgi:hypothetical protein